MRDTEKLVVGAALGALLGGAVVVLMFTDRGRSALGGVDRAADDIGTAFRHLRGAIRKAGEVVDEGLGVAAEIRAVVNEHRSSGPDLLH